MGRIGDARDGAIHIDETSFPKQGDDSDGIVYMADIPSDTRVWLNRPRVGIPERKNNRGRIPTEPRVLDDVSMRLKTSCPAKDNG